MPLTSMLKTSGSTESTTRLGKGRVGVGDNGSDDGGHVDGGSRNGDFDVTFQVTRWRSRHCSAKRTVAFNCVSEADHEKPIPVALD